MKIEVSVEVFFLHAGSFYVRVDAVDKYINALFLSTTNFSVCYRYEERREWSEELGMGYSVVTVRTHLLTYLLAYLLTYSMVQSPS